MKHAYLIMIHNDFYIFDKLIKLLDYKDNDIYVHVDSKAEFDPNKYKTKYSNIFYIKRENIKWGTYSQIQCELNLLEASSKGNYKYYHLLSGVDLPLKKQEDIHKFFDKHNEEFIAFTNKEVDENILERIKYYHLFTNNLKKNCFSTKLHYKLIAYQKKLGIKRNQNIKYQKGANWFSITDDLVKYILENKKWIKKTFNYSFCADEMFIQTLVINSKFKNRIYKGKNEYDSIKRYIDWNRGEPYTFTIEDYDELINSNMFFARKFSTKVDKEIIDKIYEKLR